MRAICASSCRITDAAWKASGWAAGLRRIRPTGRAFGHVQRGQHSAPAFRRRIRPERALQTGRGLSGDGTSADDEGEGMIRVLMVDDEPLVRRGIVAGVDWAALGVRGRRRGTEWGRRDRAGAKAQAGIDYHRHPHAEDGRHHDDEPAARRGMRGALHRADCAQRFEYARRAALRRGRLSARRSAIRS